MVEVTPFARFKNRWFFSMVAEDHDGFVAAFHGGSVPGDRPWNPLQAPAAQGAAEWSKVPRFYGSSS